MKTRIATGEAAALSLRTTESTLERMRGLLGSPPLREGEAMVLGPCNMVHTVGMRYAIDIVFADRDGVICKVCAAVPAGRMRACLPAKYVVELRAGEAARRDWQVGRRLPFLLAAGDAR